MVDQFTITKTGLRESAPVKTNNIENTLNVYPGKNETTVNYFLAEDSNVQFDLLNSLGEKISTFSQIPSFQTKGFYNFEIPLKEKSIASGVYFIRMTANGASQVKKLSMVE